MTVLAAEGIVAVGVEPGATDPVLAVDGTVAVRVLGPPIGVDGIVSVAVEQQILGVDGHVAVAVHGQPFTTDGQVAVAVQPFRGTGVHRSRRR